MRLFVGIGMPRFVREKLEGLCEELRGVSWTPFENYHLTLKFIGEVEDGADDAIAEALAEVQMQPFLLELGGVGIFPEKGAPRVLWAGLERVPPQLFHLQKKIESALFNLGYEPGTRAYRPHVTVARLNEVSEPQVRDLVKRNERFATAPFRVTEFTLFLSRIQYQRRVFTPVEIVRLSA